MRDLSENGVRCGWLVVVASVVLAGLLMVPTVATAQSSDDETSSAEETDKEPTSEAERALSLAQTAYHAGEWDDAKQAYQKAYDRAAGDSPIKVQAALGISSIEWEQGSYASARSHVESALDLAKKLNLDSAVGRLLMTLGHIQASQGELADAEQTLSHCISLASAQNDPVFGPLCRLNHRMVRKLQGKDIGSERVYKQALEELKSVDTPMTVGMSLAKTAQLYSKSGDYNRALSMIDQAEAQYQKAASEPAQARIRLDRARMLQDLGRWNAGRQQLSGLVETFQSMGSKPALVDVYGLLGDDARHRGNTEKAATYYNQALSHAEAAGSPQLTAKVHVALCELQSEPAGRCQAALDTLADVTMPGLRARAHSAYGRKLQTGGDLKKARTQFQEALSILDDEVADSVVSPSMRVANLSNLCQVETRAEITGAFSRCRDAVRAIEDLKDDQPQMLATTQYSLGVAAINEGSPKTGVEHLQKAAEIFVDIEGQGDRAADAWLRAGDALNQADRHERAAKNFKNGLDAAGDGDASRNLRIQLRTQLAQVLSERQKWKEAAGVLDELISDAKAAGRPGDAAWAYSLLARTHVQRDDDASAEQALQTGIDLAEEAGDDELASSMKENLKQFE